MKSEIYLLSLMVLLVIFMFIYKKSYEPAQALRYHMMGMDRYETNHVDLYDSGPVVTLGFIHMRKAGGTHFDTIINVGY